MTTVEEILQNCTVNGLVVKLPPVKLDKKLYAQVSKALDLIGGTWKGGKTFGFVFQSDPAELLKQILNEETRSLKNKYQFFETPSELAQRLIKLAEIEPHDHILEPSAGQGAILKEIQSLYGHIHYSLDYYELMESNRTILENEVNKGLRAICAGNDFLLNDEKYKWDKIIANPPFQNNQDIDHIRKMYSCLKSGGKLVSIASKHWRISKNRKEIDFKYWLANKGALVIDTPTGAFKESGTTIPTVIIIITKGYGE